VTQMTFYAFQHRKTGELFTRRDCSGNSTKYLTTGNDSKAPRLIADWECTGDELRTAFFCNCPSPKHFRVVKVRLEIDDEETT